MAEVVIATNGGVGRLLVILSDDPCDHETEDSLYQPRKREIAISRYCTDILGEFTDSSVASATLTIDRFEDRGKGSYRTR